MYCTKCGKELYPDDRFCAYCGAEVRNREKPKPKYEDIVFNPPFKIEAEKKTREILQEEGKLYTQIKIDEISNLGTVKIRLRSLFATLEQRRKQ